MEKNLKERILAYLKLKYPEWIEQKQILWLAQRVGYSPGHAFYMVEDLVKEKLVRKQGKFGKTKYRAIIQTKKREPVESRKSRQRVLPLREKKRLAVHESDMPERFEP